METSAFPTSTVGVLHGIQDVVTVQAPAAGSEWSYTVPGGYYRRLITAAGTLTTSATVANRIPGVQVTDGQRILYFMGGGTVFTASLVVKVSISGYGQVTSSIVTVPFVTTGLPPLWLPPGYVISSSTTALQAGDQWSAMVFWWECIDRNRLPHSDHQAIIEVDNLNIRA